MKKKVFTLLLSISCSNAVFADDAFFSFEFSEGISQTFDSENQAALLMTALRDFKLTDLVINSGRCPFTIGDAIFGKPYYRYADFLANFPISGKTYSPKQTFGIKVGCHSDGINEIVIETDKGIQTIQFNIDTKPIISVKPLSEKVAIFDKKTEMKPLNELYQVSNYTCYQDKNSSDEVVEYCTPLPAKDVKDFNLPFGELMSKPLFAMRATETARRARYIEFVETFPKELPTFKAKRLPSVAQPSSKIITTSSTEEEVAEDQYDRAKTKLYNRIGKYERDLLELVEKRINNTKREKKVEEQKQALARMEKTLSTKPSEGLKRNIEDLERSIVWELGYLESYMLELPRLEAKLAENKKAVDKAKEEVLQRRSALEMIQEFNSSKEKIEEIPQPPSELERNQEFNDSKE